METRLANIAIIVEKRRKCRAFKQILHKYGSYIIGRMNTTTKNLCLGHRFFKFVHVILYHIKIIKEAVWRPDLQTLQSLWKKKKV